MDGDTAINGEAVSQIVGGISVFADPFNGVDFCIIVEGEKISMRLRNPSTETPFEGMAWCSATSGFREDLC